MFDLYIIIWLTFLKFKSILLYMKQKTKKYLIEFFGSQRNMCKKTFINEGNLSTYLNANKPLPLKHALAIIKLTNGGLSLDELCPLQKTKK
jgi:DNA-binding transcriptional regulator YdaS (Cro superfamily)